MPPSTTWQMRKVPKALKMQARERARTILSCLAKRNLIRTRSEAEKAAIFRASEFEEF